MLVPLALNPDPFIFAGSVTFIIISAQSSFAFTSLVAIYPLIPLDVIILSHTYSFCELSTFFSILVTIAPLPKEAKYADFVLGSALTARPSVQTILN